MKDKTRFRILNALFEEKQLTMKEMLLLDQSCNYIFLDELLWNEQNVNGYKVYELSEHGLEVYKYLKQKKLKELLIRILMIIIAAIIICYSDIKK